MAIVKQSFISNIVGRIDNCAYEQFKGYTKIIIIVGTCILSIVLLLSFFFHHWIISSLLNRVTSTSFFFIIYVAAIIVKLDIRVDVDEPEKYYWSMSIPEKKPKPTAYKFTVVWGVLLIILGLGAIYFSNEYRRQYAFDCDTFFVDHQAGIYHLDWDNDCEVLSETDKIEKMQGYQIDKSYTLCKWCEEWAEVAEDEYGTNRYFRR